MQGIHCFLVSKKKKNFWKWETVDHTDVLATDLLATADSADEKLNVLAKCYFNTEKVLVKTMKDFLLTQSFQKNFLSGSLKICV